MPEHILSLYNVGTAKKAQGPTAPASSTLDLDWELQRLLGEELKAMEPAKASAAAPAVKTQSAPAKSTPVKAIPIGAPAPAAASTATAAKKAATRPAAPAPTAATPTKATPAAATAAAARPAATAPAVATPAASVVPQPPATTADTLALQIETLYQQATHEIGSKRELLKEVTELLSLARGALSAGNSGITDAEKYTMQAQGLIKNKEDSRRWASTYGIVIMGYQFLFIAGFIGMLAFDRPLALWAGALTGVTEALTMRDILPFWETMMWGGIGGGLGALYSLYWHVAEEQDFDRQYNMWYVVQPIMGSMLGALIYLIVASGLMAMHSTIPSTSSWFPATLACLCGFRQRFIFELIDKMMEVIGLQPLMDKAKKTQP